MIATGQTFAGYELEQRVGEGGTGDVWRARDPRLGRAVALRIVAPEIARDAVTRARLNRESTALASVDHPNVAPIYDAGEHDGRIVIASRWVDGVQLNKLVRDEGPMAPRRAVRVVNQVASALEAAHKLGIMHRNVKPSSVIVTPSDHVYLTNFGLARRSGDMTGLTVQEQLLDTFDYVAPEYIQGAPVDARADIYGLGCILYEALTAEVPYPRSGAAAKMYAHLSAEPPSPRARRPEVPERLDSVVRRAMAKNPDDRPQSAAEFATDAAGAVELSAPLWAARVAGEVARHAIDSPRAEDPPAGHAPAPAVDPPAPAVGAPAPVGAVPSSAAADARPPAPARHDSEPRDRSAEERGEFYEPVYYLKGDRELDRPRSRPARPGAPAPRGMSSAPAARRMSTRTAFWIVATLIFLAAPIALIIALLGH